MDHCVWAKNELAKVCGHAPCEYFAGRMPRRPLDGLGLDAEVPLPTIDLLDSDKDMYERVLGVQAKAREAFEQLKSRKLLSEAVRHRSRPTRGPYSPGEQVFYWRRWKSGAKLGSGVTKHDSWHGRAVVLGQQGSTYWLTHGGRIVKAAPEHLRKVVPGEELP